MVWAKAQGLDGKRRFESPAGCRLRSQPGIGLTDDQKALSGKFNMQSVSKNIELVVPDAGHINDQFVVIQSAAVDMNTGFTKLERECYIEGLRSR